MLFIRSLAEFVLSLLYYCVQFIFNSGSQKEKSNLKQEEVFWRSLSFHLFEQHSVKSRAISERLEGALQAVAKNLNLRNALLIVHREHGSEILVHVNDSYRKVLDASKSLQGEHAIRGLLNSNRENLAIDSASLTEWHRHPARAEIGWETFIGSFAELAPGVSISLGFYDFLPRDHLYSMKEKKMVQNLARWLSTMLESELNISVPHYTSQETVRNLSMSTS